MYSFHEIKTAAATLIVGFVLASTFAATALGGNGLDGLTPQQFKAVRARAEAMNRYYHLGAYSPAALALKAEEAEGQAANQYYHLGRYAVVESANPFQWSAAGIGAGAMLGTILLAGGLAIVLHRRRVEETSFPSTT